MLLRRAALLAAACCAAGCSGSARRGPAPPSADLNGGLGLSVLFARGGLPQLEDHLATEAAFARLSPDGEPDLDRLYPGWAGPSGVLYLLDAPAGRYAPVVVGFRKGRTRYRLRTTPQEQREWAAPLSAGALSFGGLILVQRERPTAGAWALDGLRRMAQYLPPFRAATIELVRTGFRIDRRPEAEAVMLRQARVDLSGTMWIEPAEKRMADLGDPAPPLVEGLLRKRPVKAADGGEFTWIDTLEWGAPRRVPGGLEWRQPRGRASILVAFLAPGDPRYRPLPDFLRELKAAGSPEDDRSAREVAVSSRAAFSLIYTTYQYPGGAVLGAETRVVATEAILAPAKGGLYLLQYRAPREHFARHRQEFRRFLDYLRLKRPAPPPPPREASL